jgi:hypothetical protein
MQGSWNRDRHRLREPSSAYDPDRETAWWGRLCCALSVFELFTCCALGALTGAAGVSFILLICAAHQ